MIPELNYISIFNKYIQKHIFGILKTSFKNPLVAFSVLKTLFKQRSSAKIRNKLKAEGLEVPPVVIISLTNRCNLACTNCYEKALRPGNSNEISADKLKGILSQAQDLGVSIVIFAGGEPLLLEGLFEVTVLFPGIIFLIFTNGILVDLTKAEEFAKQRHVVPLISLEGDQEVTDDRRGIGVFESVTKTLSLLNKKDIIFGASITITSRNYGQVTDDGFVRQLITLGCKTVFYIEYVAINNETLELALTSEQKSRLISSMEQFDDKYGAVFAAFPGDEERYGGCLASGRGFLHINSNLDVEPCPFAPFSDANLGTMPLKEALKSSLLKQLKENHDKLKEGAGGCALWNNREWVNSIAGKSRQV